MCGIAGILSLSPDVRITRAPLATMAAQLVHRGPDDEGYYLDPQGRCGLAFRRLSIIDVAGGHQPLANENQTVWTVLNGEIYNFPELRAELQHQGHTLATRSDTEVIVHLYEQYGEACFNELAGMFAIALWDQPAGRLLLVRDRFGKKPLTYAVHNNCLYFASEAKAILALPEIPRMLDAQSLHRYLVFQYVPAPHSIYKHFHKVLPGHYVSVEAHRPPPERQRRYWRLDPPPFDGGYKEAKARLGELLTAAVQRRLIADVPLGAFLSGGMDSSIVVSLMRELGVSPLRTFSIGFPDPQYDETRYARLVAEHFHTEHHEHIVTPQAREILDTLAWHYDEPFADSSAIPTYYVSRWARESVTVALTGDAGDECFAGYERYQAARAGAWVDWFPRLLRRPVAYAAALLRTPRPRTLRSRVYRFLSVLSEMPAQQYLSWINVFPPALLAVGYTPEFRTAIHFDEPALWFTDLYDSGAGSAAERAIHADFASYLPYDLLTKVDIASMACGLECRAPMLDHELVAFARSLPLGWRLGLTGGKRILKDWARDRLPPAILRRGKMGFGVPVGAWFRGELQDVVRARLLSPESLSAHVFRSEWLHGLVDAHLSGRANYEHPLWALLMLELWHQRWAPAL
jgi:asparagine synthase (glutamine-hydrolysing)